MWHKGLIVGTALLVVLAAPGGDASAQDKSPELVRQYFDLLVSGNLQTARDLWTSEALERAERFGITFEGIPIKADCASPVIRNLEEMQIHLDPPVRNYDVLEPGAYSKLHFAALVNGRQIDYNYYARRLGEYYWFIYPQDYYSRDWPVTETRFFRIHAHPDVVQFLNPVMTDAFDEFVEDMAGTLGLDKDRIEEMETKKIEYFYCDTDETVELITGHRTKGMLDLGSNDLISATFPHYHELIHLLVNIRLHTLPLYTQPVAREGIAVHFGGRWGKHPAALRDLGVFLYREQLVSLDSILTWDGFAETSGADISYPVAGLFAEFLIDEIGLDKYFDLYVQLSGSFEEVDRQTVKDVRAIIATACGKTDWSEVVAAFESYIDKDAVKHSTTMAGLPDNGKTILEDDGYRVLRNGDWLGFEFVARADTARPEGNLLFGHDDHLDGARSALFAEHYGSEYPYEGYRWGVRYDANEAGLYDYATNRLVAKYILGISPPGDYLSDDQHRVSICFRRDMLHKVEPSNKDHKLLAH